MCVVALSCDCGDRAAGRYRWQYSGRAQMRSALERLVDGRIGLRRAACSSPSRRASSHRSVTCAVLRCVVHSQTLPIMSTQTEPVGRECAHRRGADPAERAVVAVREAALPGVGHQLAAGRRPRHPRRRSWCCRRRPRTPTRPRSAAAGPPSARRPPRRGRRPARRDGPAVVGDPSLPGPNGCRQHAPGAQSHHCRQSRRSTGPARRPEHQRAGQQIGRRRHRDTAPDRVAARRP